MDIQLKRERALTVGRSYGLHRKVDGDVAQSQVMVPPSYNLFDQSSTSAMGTDALNDGVAMFAATTTERTAAKERRTLADTIRKEITSLEGASESHIPFTSSSRISGDRFKLHPNDFERYINDILDNHRFSRIENMSLGRDETKYDRRKTFSDGTSIKVTFWIRNYGVMTTTIQTNGVPLNKQPRGLLEIDMSW